MSLISTEEDLISVSANAVQSEANGSDTKDAQKFRPMQPVLPAPQQAYLPDSNDSTPSDKASTSRPRPDSGAGGAGFKMPIFKGPIRKISKVKSTRSLPEKSFADSTTPSQPENKNYFEEKTASDDNANKLKKISKRSPAEKLATPPPPYREPAWSGIPENEYYLEVLKGGAISAKIGLNDHPFHLFGRLETNHVQLDHPSLSRYHAVLQYRSVGDNDHDPGFYLYDLGSTHGTTLNKKQIEPKVYCRIQVGHMFKLAGSTRIYILQGGNTETEEKGNDLSIEQLKEMQQRRMEEKELLRMKDDGRKEEIEDESSTGISWGMAEDADAESDLSHNPFALDVDDDKEAPYLKDPKKTLRGFFEREGDELEYNVEEMGIGRSHEYICKVVLPLDDASGSPIVAEASVSGKKKEAVLACALEACKILDRHGVLRQAKHESKKRKDKNWAADDYYDSDEDTFLDRTGEIEKKRIKRMRKAGADKQETLTYDKLLLQLQELEKEIKKVEDNLATMADGNVERMAEDSLDAFMDSIKSGFKDRNQRGKLKLRLVELRKEQLKLNKLINIAKPAKMPELKGSAKGGPSSSTKPKMQPMIGKIHGAKKFRFSPLVSKLPAVTATSPPEEEEEEDELDDGSKKDVKEPVCQPDPNQSKENEFNTGSKSSNISQYSTSAETPLEPTSAVKGPSLHPKSSAVEPSSTSATEQQTLAPSGPSMPPVKGPGVHPKSSAVEPSSTSATEQQTLAPRGPSMPSVKGPGVHPKSSAVEPSSTSATEQQTLAPRGPSMPSVKGPSLHPKSSAVEPSSTSATEQQTLAPRGPSMPPVKGPGVHPSSSAIPRGPMLPPNYGTDELMDDDDEEGRKSELYKNKRKVSKDTEEEVHDWVPPIGQTGDGRTSLNDKFGY